MKEAAQIANVSLGKWFEIARKKELPYRLSTDDLKKDVKTARKF